MRFALVPLLLLSLTALTACRDAKVTSYRVPAEKPDPLPPVLTGDLPAPRPAAPATGGDMANTAVPTATGAGLTWTAPAHWKEKPASAMRRGSYSVTDESGAEADLSITAFPGDVGGDLANINRWRGQIGLPPITAADLAGATQHLDFNGLHMTFVEIANPAGDKPQRIIGAFIPYEGATWFVKLTGPDGLVAREKPTVLAFLETIKASASTAR